MHGRKLASIQRIAKLEPITGADRIEKATVMGWNVVVGKGEFSVGDRCVFFEIDAVLPGDAKWAGFMEPRGFRVKTAKLKGCLSQGLALQIHILPTCDHGSYKVGDDVTGILDVKKYEPTNIGPDTIGPFPDDVPKTDEMRLQSALGVLDELRGKPFYVTVKLDGMSGTFVRRDEGLSVCSRNCMLRESDGPHWTVARRYSLASLPVGFAIQGEVCGPSIQGNRLGLKEPDLFVFNVYNIPAGRYLDWEGVALFCHKYGLKTVPYEFDVTSSEEIEGFPMTLENFINLAEGTYEGSGKRREGIVVRPTVECRSETLGGGRLSFKVISNDFLLHDEL